MPEYTTRYIMRIIQTRLPDVFDLPILKQQNVNHTLRFIHKAKSIGIIRVIRGGKKTLYQKTTNYNLISPNYCDSKKQAI